ncbi:hypothetical protein KY320_03715 [Candidatus Woesearchaeota archaeon]|nr:hypothetical protein [Candidatus Woesearchaeota archaeon]
MKKGAISALVLIILAIIAGFVVMELVNIFGGTAAEFANDRMCTESIITAVQTKIFDYECHVDNFFFEKQTKGIATALPKNTYSITADYGNKVDKKEMPSEMNPDDFIKRQIADQMLRCWQKSGEGKLNPYLTLLDEPPFLEKDANLVRKSRSFCLICAKFHFKNYEDFEALNLWMTKNKPYTPEDADNPEEADNSYFEIMYERPPTSDEQVRFKNTENPDYVVNTSHEYAIVWRVYFTSLTGAWDVPSGESKRDDSQDVIFIPYSEMLFFDPEADSNLDLSYCNYIMN